MEVYKMNTSVQLEIKNAIWQVQRQAKPNNHETGLSHLQTSSPQVGCSKRKSGLLVLQGTLLANPEGS